MYCMPKLGYLALQMTKFGNNSRHFGMDEQSFVVQMPLMKMGISLVQLVLFQGLAVICTLVMRSSSFVDSNPHDHEF